MGAPVQPQPARPAPVTTPRRARRARRWLLGVALAAPLAGAADCSGLLDVEPPTCTAHCDVEETCGLRSEADCLAASCDPLTGEPLSVAANDCLAAARDAEDCLLAASCACDDGCARLDTCAEAGAPDETCASSCAALVEQLPTQTYLENRCRIEAAECSELATCSSVSG